VEIAFRSKLVSASHFLEIARPYHLVSIVKLFRALMSWHKNHIVFFVKAAIELCIRKALTSQNTKNCILVVDDEPDATVTLKAGREIDGLFDVDAFDLAAFKNIPRLRNIKPKPPERTQLYSKVRSCGHWIFSHLFPLNRWRLG
jgi:hypothetical protein